MQRGRQRHEGVTGGDAAPSSGSAPSAPGGPRQPDDRDAALVRGLRSGDPGAFDAAYERYRARIYSFLVRLAGDRTVAEDLMQEVWMRLARCADRLEPDTRLAPWLYTVARNLFVSHRRWALLDLERLAELRLWRAVRREPDSPFELVAANETEQRLERALAALPLPYREVLLLVVVEHLPPGEAAAILGLGPEALRQRLSRARAMIAKALAERERAARPRGLPPRSVRAS